jgi:cellulose 1,4-beta-cellobiosidase
MALSLVAVAAATIFPWTASSAASAAGVSCQRWQALHVTGTDGQPYVIRNKPSINHNDEGMCLSVAGPAGFTVTRSPGTGPSGKVRAYPYIGTGCFAGACAGPVPGLYPRAGALGNLTVHWTTVTPSRSGVWNSSLDLWLGPHSGAGTSEVMIWLRYSKPSWWAGLYPTVTLDGARWYVVPHTTAPGRYYLSFRRARPAQGATLRLAPFMAVAERYGAVSRYSRLWSVQAGFEIWSGGQGLAVSRFSVTR